MPTIYSKTGQTYESTQTWVTLKCGKCHVIFAITEQHYDDLQDHGGTFCCPNGHPRHFIESEVQRLTKERDRFRRERDVRDGWYRSEQADHARTKRERDGHKGHVTRIKRRISHGVCPCCMRTFKQLARHMKSQHPGYVDEPDVPAEVEA